MHWRFNPKIKFIIKAYTFEYYVKFSFWVSVAGEKRYNTKLTKHFIAFRNEFNTFINTVARMSSSFYQMRFKLVNNRVLL